MIGSREITFNRFYELEFLQTVRMRLSRELSAENAELMIQLIDHLRPHDDMTAGIEKLAREQGTGELSIFLFDIFDRIEDYPPTVAYDALQDIVEDFVSAVSVMLEEEITVEAIKIVNAEFAGDAIAPEIPKSTEPEIIAEPQEEVELVEETDKSYPLTDKEPDSIPFELFVAIEVEKMFKNYFDSTASSINSENLYKFSDIVLDIVELPTEGKVPQTLLKLMQVRQMLFPWRYELDYKASKIMTKLSENVKKFTDLIMQLSQENEEIVVNSLEDNRIVLQKTEFIREEVAADPTTIDGLLAEYFSSEVKEHLEQIRNTLSQLQEKPENKTVTKELIAHFQSLNEISMIHGYSPIESFCSHITAILNNGIKENLIFNREATRLFDRLFDILNYAEPLKDAHANTKEAIDLTNLAEEMAEELLIARGKKVKERPKKESKPTEEPSLPEMPIEEEPEKQIAESQEISFEEQERIFDIFKEVLVRSQQFMERHLLEKRQPEKAITLLDTLSGSAGLLGNPQIRTVFNEFRQFVLKINSDNDNNVSEAIKFMSAHYEDFVKKLTPDMDSTKIKAVLDAYKPKPELISIGDVQKLLQILGTIENRNQEKFIDTLTKISEGDETLRESQSRHFRRLYENLTSIGSTNFTAFPQFYMNIFENKAQIEKLDKSILQELSHSYKLFVESLSGGGTGVDTGDLVAILEELISTPVEEELSGKDDFIEPQQEDKEKTPSEEGEEDLDEIFRQESENSFAQITKSLELLENDLNSAESYGVIERNLHSLKSSARLMGYTEVAEIAAPLEDICENIHSGQYGATKEALDLIREGINLLKTKIGGGEVEYKPFKEKIGNLTLPELTKKDIEEKDVPIDEKPLFSTSDDEDADLLDVFKDESDQYIKVLEKANQALTKDLANKNSLKALETASHSLKSAAKMLGFREIGQLGDSLEIAAEAMHKGEVPNTQIAQEHIAQSIDFIKKLTAGEKADPSQLGNIISALQPDKLKSYGVTPENEEDDRATFLREATDLLEKLNSDLVKIEKKPEDPALLNNLYRNMHTLKGGAQIMQYDKIGAIAHRIEDFFEAAREGEKAISSDTLDPIFKAIDEIQSLTDGIRKNGTETSKHYDEVLNAISEIPDIGEKPSRTPVIRQIDEKASEQSENGQEQTIKMTTQSLDHLMNMAAGLIVNKTQLNNYLESMKTIVNRIDKDRNRLRSTRNTIDTLMEMNEDLDPNVELPISLTGLNQAAQDFNDVLSTLDGVSSDFYSITQHLEENIREISLLTKQLHDDILQARMVPGEVLFNRFPRAVRDLARKQKKKINLMVQGESTELDRAMIEALTDPVMHLIRNAIDHGVETPKERKTKGKTEDGIVLLKALRDKNQIIIEVHDDGRGIDPAVIAEKAVQLGLVEEKQVKKMRNEEILDLIFAPGFSTTEKATDLSGRGIGLDVVATEIQKLNGDIRLSSTLDKGTIFRIRVPLTLAITQAMLVELDGEIVAIQISAIDEAIEIANEDIEIDNDLTYLKFRDQRLPIKNLANFLNYEEKERKPDKPSGLIIYDGEIKYVLQVDAVLRREEIVVKNLGPELKDVAYISGGTVLGDGSVVLLLDIAAITHKIELEYAGEGRDFSSLETARQVLSGQDERKTGKKQTSESKKKKIRKAKEIGQKKISGRKPVALIIDDSLSVRKFVSAVLERNNYITVLTSDGPEALEKMNENDFDIIITDLEMPKMHGFDLIGEIRNTEKFKEVPIIILTGKSGREHEEKGKKAGANAYIIKPFKEGDLVKTLEKFITT